MPDSIKNTNENTLLIANGINRVLRWDGVKHAAETAGVIPPSSALTVSGSGVGNILGTYFAYVRFVDKYGNISNLSPISAEYTTNGQSGTITNATKSEPIKITSAAHGLLTGALVKVSGVEGMTEANGTWFITVIDANKFSLDGSSGVNTYTGGGEWIAGQSTITYTNVPVPTEDKVVTKQILRNTDGQTTTFYVDIETNNVGVTTFQSTKTDTELSDGTAVPLFDDNGNDLAVSFYSRPPSHKAVLCQHKGRMWLASEIDYKEGAVAVTLGSTTVTGIKTEWSTEMAGREFYVVGTPESFTITSVNPAAQTLTLETAYTGETDPYGYYAISPAIGERRFIYFSAANLPEAWPPTNVIAIEENGDDIVGLVGQASFLYILEKRHIYRLSFQTDPLLDGQVWLSAYRGCINNRCWVALADGIYMMDYSGVHLFDGSGSRQISKTIQDIFENRSEFFKINWKAAPYFHAVLDQQKTTIRWFVALAGNTLPQHAICVDYINQRWWVEEYPFPIGCSDIVEMNAQPKVLLGGPCRRVYALGESELDATTPDDGDTRGTVTSVTPLSLTDSTASFADELLFSTVCIVGGRGKGQSRRIIRVAESNTRLDIDRPWDEIPSASGADQSTYQVGGIPWEYVTGWFHVIETEKRVMQRLDVYFDPTDNESIIDLEVFVDHDTDPIQWALDVDDGKVRMRKLHSEAEMFTTVKSGYTELTLNNIREFLNYGPRWFSFSLSGAKGVDPLVVNHIEIRGLVGRSAVNQQ